MGDDLDAARGAVIGMLIGVAAWAVMFGTVLSVIRWARWW